MTPRTLIPKLFSRSGEKCWRAVDGGRFAEDENGTTPWREDAERREPSASADLRRGDILAARYEIEALLGRGGMASVYRAFDRVTRTVIAVRLHPARSAGRVGWGTSSGSLRHARKVQRPNVCRVHDLFEDDGYCFLTPDGGAHAILDGVAAIHAAESLLGTSS